MKPPPRLLTFLTLALLAPAAGAQVTIGPDGVPRGPGEEAAPAMPTGPEVTELTVSPAPLPVPPLKYRLVIPAEDRRPGSAATYWYRAELIYFEDEANLRWGNSPELDRQTAASDLLEEPPASLTPDRLDAALGLGSGIFEIWSPLDAADEAAHRPPAEWGFGLDDLTGTETVEFLLPEFQNARALARLLALRGRARVGRGDFDGALADAAVLLRLAEDCGRAPFIISDLIGFAVRAIAHHHVLEAAVAAPGSPNLYYALTELPDPAAGLADSWEQELGLPYRFAPWLRDAETLDWTADRWRTEWIGLVKSLQDPPGLSVMSDVQAGFLVGTLLSVQLEPARAALIEDGFDPKKLDKMPPGQVLAIRQNRVMRELIDPFRVAAAAPLPEGLELAEAAEQNLRRSRQNAAAGSLTEPVPLASLLLPAVSQVRLAGARAQVDVASLRAVEALRAHAANAGSFPESLDAVEVVTVPDNPLTGEPFPYRLEGDTAVLEVTRHPTNEPSNRVLRLTLRDEQ